MTPDLQTPYLWAACLVTDLVELENFRDTLKGLSPSKAMDAMAQISGAVKSVVTLSSTSDSDEVVSAASSPISKLPRREPATHSTRSTPTKTGNSPRPHLTPVKGSPGKAGSGGGHQTAQSGSPISPGKKKQYRKKRAVQITKQRDSDTCPLLGTRYCEAAHVYPFAAIDRKFSINSSLLSLVKVFGETMIDRLSDDLLMTNLDSCAINKLE
ncbi:hypothetical protein BDP81DRAFT_397016 [Colletotrichum phormii]|uniref:Uncharacterized protein n=1 Tax=Colletotrichum phormii TaxID=359342 RepID=A0AAJ0EC54_9PEZI|nr:uncharacterized protein BDP81DRAFT_397016 [Colletotrichum phormii]KAK1633654.1 hypothetical protein BDP81DRAFT_397016 [Colletotrichum phormii]